MLSLLIVLAQVASFSLDFRYKKLKETTEVIDLDSKKFKLYTEEPRNYTVFMLLTTSSPQHQCVACKDFLPEFNLVAKNHGKNDLFFGVLDYVSAPDVFAELEINNVPLVLRFPPTTKEFKIAGRYDKYDLSKNGFKAEPFASYISKTYGVDVKVQRPVDYTPFLFFGLGGFAIAVLFMALKDFVGKVLGGKAPWLLFVVAFSTIQTGGYMWNTIRTPPFVAQGQDGKPQFIAGGFQNQFGVETFIVALLYGAVSLSILLLTDIAKKFPASKQKGVAYTGLISLFVSFSLLLALFKVKNGGYPFKLVSFCFILALLKGFKLIGLIKIYKYVYTLTLNTLHR